jgi:hypothetical protein
MALIGVLEACEKRFGEEGQQLVYEALRKVGYDVGRQILDGVELPQGIGEAEFVSFYATVVNRIAYASLEEPRIEDDDKVSFDIVWCPHQDHYKAFDCRVQRYFVQGMVEAARDITHKWGFEVRFDTTIPSGAPTCHFTMWRASPEEKKQWESYTRLVEQKALVRAGR